LEVVKQMTSDDVTTIREMITMLTALADEVPTGLDTTVEFGICDGESLQIVDDVDVSHWTNMREATPEGVLVLIRGHNHPGTRPGRLLRGGAADVDAELRKLTDGDAG
jgi:hypothetical protein